MTRKTSTTARRRALTAQLKDMFGALSARAVPDTVMSVVDQLDEGEAQAKARPTRAKA